MERKLKQVLSGLLFLLAALLVWLRADQGLFPLPPAAQETRPPYVQEVSPAPPAPAPFDPAALPDYAGEPVVEINGNLPYFDPAGLTAVAFETYSELDSLGRCGPAYACLGRELMPTGPREAVGQIKPSGWRTVRYDDLIKDRYLYNRCHLIGYQLAGENSNEKNLITGTRWLNVSGMLPYENKVASYIQRTDGHVLYRVTPVFRDGELVARGVLMEALSVEDGGEGLRFCVYVFNVQPGIVIDYATGDSARAAPAEDT